ncbi:cytochrome c oxidase subunit II [Oligoflexia bacterium]|nr:cytochrome c oxidase subunit II [Oligoflexia bacterium]
METTTTIGAINFSFYIIFWISVVLLLGVTVAMLYFVVKYHHKRSAGPKNIEGHFWLEVVWTVIPTLLVLVMFYYGWVGFERVRDVPKDAMVVKVTGQMWSWLFEYENGKQAIDLYVPVNKPVKLVLTSRDVNHSFFVSAFKLKEDCIPGRENYLWFEANKVAAYDIQCAEYCGTRHSAMLAKLHVLPKDGFDLWYNTILETKQMKGDQLLRIKGCLSCHSLDGTKLVGPSFKGLFGRKEIVKMRGGEASIVADEEYLRESILNPEAKIVKGYPAGQMPPQEGLLSEEELDHMLKYLEELQ